MTENKRQLVLDTSDNKPTSRVPVGFWFHFVHPEHQDYRNNPSIIQQNIDGHKKFFSDFQPDFVKLMSDGFFPYPNPVLMNHKSLQEFESMKPLGENNEWITKQVDMVKKQKATFTYDVATFYNVFSPSNIIKFMIDTNSLGANAKFADWIMENKKAVKHALDTMAIDIATMVKKVITEGGADGIYFSVQNIQDPRITKEVYDEVLLPSEMTIIEAAKSVSNYNMLHICGYDGFLNHLDWYLSYPASCISWASTVEHVSLKEGKKLFGGRCVIGGFPNTKESILFKGTKEEITAETKRLVEEAGKVGVIIGADCSLPYDISIDHLKWVREALQ